MPVHSIPEDLIRAIDRGDAVLVAGTGIGLAPWRELLNVMWLSHQRRSQNRTDDPARDVAVEEVGELLERGNLARAAGYLEGALGEEQTRLAVAEVWETGAASRAEGDLAPLARAIAHVPIRHIWTTTPGRLLARALDVERPAEWPECQVVTPVPGSAEPLALDRNRRALMPCFGAAELYAFPPRSARRLVRRAEGMRQLVADAYAKGALLFVGFEFGDPDFSVLLRDLLPGASAPQGTHYFVGGDPGQVAADELWEEHRIRLVEVSSGEQESGWGDAAEFVEALARECESRGITLAESRPGEADLAGWAAVLAGDPDDTEARQVLERMCVMARQSGDAERLVEALMARLEAESSPRERGLLLLEIAVIFDEQRGDSGKALTAAIAAFGEDPSLLHAAELAERCARECGDWSELVSVVGEVAERLSSQAHMAPLASSYWSRLGRFYAEDVGAKEYAESCFRRAVELSPGDPVVRDHLVELLRRQQRWVELADLLEEQVKIDRAVRERAELFLAIGDLCEGQLAEPARAAAAFERAAQLDPDSEDALVALERLYRRDHRWKQLADVLERRAVRFETEGDRGRAAAVRRELATLRAEKLGDVEGAIQKYRAAADADPTDVEAVRSLVDLYDRVGRTADYFAALEELVVRSPERERAGLCRRLGAELEEREDSRDRAVRCFETLLELEPTAEDAYRALERLYAARPDPTALADLLGRHAELLEGERRARLYEQQAALYENELSDVGSAIAAYEAALDAESTAEAALIGLERIYTRRASWEHALDIVWRRAELAGDDGADLWAYAGQIAADQSERPNRAEALFERALALSPRHPAALVGMAELSVQSQTWGNAVRFLSLAAVASTSRREKISLRLRAANICEQQLGDEQRALALLLELLELDPDHREAGQRAADMLVRQRRWEEALPILDMLSRSTLGESSPQSAARHAELARVCYRLGHFERAAEHYRDAIEGDPDNVALVAALGDVLERLTRAEGAADALWAELAAVSRSVLDRNGEEDAHVHYRRLAAAERHLGNLDEALEAFSAALDGSVHAEEREQLREAVIDVAAELGEWERVARVKRAQLEELGDELATPEQRASRRRLLEQLAGICAVHLGRADEALSLYREAIAINPQNAHSLHHRVLDILTEAGDWRGVVDVLDDIASITDDPTRRAKYRYTAALVVRDELGERAAAGKRLLAATEDHPADDRIFDAAREVLSAEEMWSELAAAYRLVLKHAGEQQSPERLLTLWSELGHLYAFELDHTEAAIAAMEVAVSLAPDDVDRRDELAELYLAGGESRRRDAIDELHELLRLAPDRVELYVLLSDLYREEGDVDASFCLAQALVLLGVARPHEIELCERNRARSLRPGRRRLTDELWRSSLTSPAQDPHLSAFFESLHPLFAAAVALPLSAFDFGDGDRVELESDHRAVARVFRYASEILGVDGRPSLYLRKQPMPHFDVANVKTRRTLAPVVVGGPGQGAVTDEQVLAFELGQKLALLRPRQYAATAFPTMPGLTSALAAALSVSFGTAPPKSRTGKRVAEELRRSLPSAVVEQLAVLADAAGLADASSAELEQAAASFRRGVELTADRAGALLCDDLDTAARQIAGAPTGPVGLSPVERLRELLAFSVSEQHLELRRHLGTALDESAGAPLVTGARPG